MFGISQESDIFPLITIFEDKIHYLDYSFPIAITNYRFMIPYPQVEHRNQLADVFLPISPMVTTYYPI